MRKGLVLKLGFLFLFTIIQGVSYADVLSDNGKVVQYFEQFAAGDAMSGRGAGFDIAFVVSESATIQNISLAIAARISDIEKMGIRDFKELIESNGGFMTGYYEDSFCFSVSLAGRTREKKQSRSDTSLIEYTTMPSKGVVPIASLGNVKIAYATERTQIFNGEVTYDFLLDHIEILSGNGMNASLSCKNPFLGDQRISTILHWLQEEENPAIVRLNGEGQTEMVWNKMNMTASLTLDNYENFTVPVRFRREVGSPAIIEESEYLMYRITSGIPCPLVVLTKRYSEDNEGAPPMIICSLQITPKLSFEPLEDEVFSPQLPKGSTVYDFVTGGQEPYVYEVK